MAKTNEVRQTIRVTIWGLCLNVFLAGLKLAVGLVVGSVALVADAVHSISDLSTDAIVIAGIQISARPADEGHPYGHGRFETIAASLVAAVLVGIAVFVIWTAGLSLYRHEHSIPGIAVLVVASVSIVSKEWMYQATRRVARRVESSALRVNAWHHRSDALSSVAVLIGAVVGLFGWGHADQLAALAVGVMVSTVGLRALWSLMVEVVEGSISTEEQLAVAAAIQSVPEVTGWNHLRTRLVGRRVFMDVTVLVDGQLTVAEGHRISRTVESVVARSMKRPVDIVVHYEAEPNPVATKTDRPDER